MTKLPKVVYVYHDTVGNEPFLVASTEPDDQDEGLVGVYDLRETLRVRHQAQFRRDNTTAWFDKATPRKRVGKRSV